MASMLEVENLKKNFGSTKVLKDVSFSLDYGESVAIIGASGSGKTTLLRCLNFLERPDSGRILMDDVLLFDGEDKDTRSEAEIRKNRLHFGMVFQSFNLFPQYTAKENIMLSPRIISRDKASGFISSYAQIERRAVRLLVQMGLSDKMYHYPHELSGGQQQRVAIARALALSPDILCFDEPTSALDPELTGEVLKVIRSLSEEKTTMIIVTHEMSFARDVADRVLFMDDGRIVEEGRACDVIDNPQHERTKKFLARYKERVH